MTCGTKLGIAIACIALAVLLSGCTLPTDQNTGVSGNGDGADENADGNGADGGEEKCWDGTPYNECGNVKPLYCADGNLVDDCGKCGCAAGKECLGDGSCGMALKTCAEQNGVICDANQLCQGGKIQASDSNNCCGSCREIVAECSDGTLHESCSSEKPFYCYNGELAEKCSVCGCPQLQECQSDESCRASDEEPTIVKFVFIKGGTEYSGSFTVNAGEEFQIEINVGDDKGVSTIELLDTSYGNTIGNEFFDCGGSRICGNVWAASEALAGANTYTAKVTDTSNQTVSLEKTITINTYCGNNICESGENSSSCPADCY